jgi:hypothetical protein
LAKTDDGGSDMNEKSKWHTSVIGIFRDRAQLENAVDTLKNRGFRNSDISILMARDGGAGGLGHEKASKAPEGATTGGVSGLALGGILGWLAGAGALAIPGIGPFVAAGPIMAAIAGAGLGGALGGVAGALAGWGIPEYEAKRYESFVAKGDILISVHVDDADWSKQAKNILADCGAQDISSTAETRAEIRDDSDTYSRRSSSADTDSHPPSFY